MNEFPKLLTAAAAAAFLAMAPVSAQEAGTAGGGQAEVQPEFELDERVSPEHRIWMTDTFRGFAVDPVTVAVDPVVGAVVPGTVVRHPVPPEIVATVPVTEGYEYIILPDGRTALVHPGTNTIAMILD